MQANKQIVFHPSISLAATLETDFSHIWKTKIFALYKN